VRTLFTTLLIAGAMAGCSASDDLTSPDTLVVEYSTSREHVTTGGAEVVFKKGTDINRLSFEAVRGQDGTSFEGQFQYSGLISGIAIKCDTKDCSGPGEQKREVHGIVRCFRIIDNRAVVAGVITHSPDEPLLVGIEVFWDVVDNGEGIGGSGPSKPDAVSLVTAGLAEVGCAKLPILDTFPVESGNVQVHGG
jgi:hypothetical protein